MGARMLSSQDDPIRPEKPEAVSFTLDGEPVTGVLGQSIAGVLLASDRLGFRQTAKHDKPRGVFCGIGVCFDCLVEVNGLRDVRACQRRARDGDVVVTQRPSESSLSEAAEASESRQHGGAA